MLLQLEICRVGGQEIIFLKEVNFCQLLKVFHLWIVSVPFMRNLYILFG